MQCECFHLISECDANAKMDSYYQPWAAEDGNLIMAIQDGNFGYLNQLDVKNLLVVSASQVSAEQLIYKPV
jgi:hypothetical protein